MYAEAQAAAATEVDLKMPAKHVAEALRLRSTGEAEVKRLRTVLFPEDDDG